MICDMLEYKECAGCISVNFLTGKKFTDLIYTSWLYKSLKSGNGTKIPDEKCRLVKSKYLENKKATVYHVSHKFLKKNKKKQRILL